MKLTDEERVAIERVKLAIKALPRGIFLELHNGRLDDGVVNFFKVTKPGDRVTANKVASFTAKKQINGPPN
jgi:hypothetical protein